MQLIEQYDVLIVGAGPAGLLAAVWMAKAGIKTLLIEQEPKHTKVGRADGLESRTLEILDSFGIGEDIWKETNKTVEICLWSELSGEIHRVNVSNNCQADLSRFQEATLAQGRIEEHLQNFVAFHDCVEIRWGTRPISLNRERGVSDTKKRETVVDQETTVQAKYVVGCDGAHSWVRKQLGLALEGETSDEHWGVIDCIPITNFPDVRKRCIIKRHGNLMIIPREKKLVRFYIQLQDTVAAQFTVNGDTELLVNTVQKMLDPYFFETSHIVWSTNYTIGQRLCRTLSVDNRIFLAGDAIHTHSPTAGQGMNVSMQDTYNLGWKLAMVVKGLAVPELLDTYQQERFPVAERLVSFDRRMCEGICTLVKDHPGWFKDKSTTMRKALEEENSSASGLTVVYGPNLIVTPVEDFTVEKYFCCSISSPLGLSDASFYENPVSKSHLARNIVIGRRLPSVRLMRQSDSNPLHLQEQFESTGQWHLLVFAGNIAETSQMTRVQNVSSLLSDTKSFFSRLNKNVKNSPFGSVVAYLVHSANRSRVELMDMPEIFRPFDREIGYEYGRIFADNKTFHGDGGDAYEYYGIAPEGCLVLLRPDQHVAFVGGLEDTNSLNVFFARFSSALSRYL